VSDDDRLDSASSPPVGWAQRRELPPGYSKPPWRPGERLWIAYGVLFVVGLVLIVWGTWLTRQPESIIPTAHGPLHRHNPGDLIRWIGVGLLGLGLVVSVISIALKQRAATRASSSGSPQRRGPRH
jgi:protein-S-isoprenylcysteine O-methyltransferase Ste14